MPLKFRLKGLAETFVDHIRCPGCGHDGGDDGDQGFQTELTRVTYDGIIVVIQCSVCGSVFVPDGQRHGVINSEKLRLAVERDSVTTGMPILPNRESVRLEVERMNAEKGNKVQ